MSDRTTKECLKTTCIYNTESENVQDLLSESFALFVEKGLANSDVSWYNAIEEQQVGALLRAGCLTRENCGRFLIGGTKCTRK